MSLKNNLLFGLLLVFASTSVFSQNIHKLEFNYESNVFSLTAEQKTKIDSVIKLLPGNKSEYEIDIVGHADNVGSSAANYEISISRAENVMSYFETKGFSRDDISVSGKGLSKPIKDNSTDEGKYQNRRVTISIQKHTDNEKSSNAIRPYGNKGFAGLSMPNKRYKVNADEGGVIKYASGTKLTVPADAFAFKNGKPVTGELEIVYIEYRDPIDFLISGIPMAHVEKGKMYRFNSAGMFKILAFYKGIPIYLKPEKKIQVDFATTSQLENLNFYSLDTIKENWKELENITGQNTVTPLSEVGNSPEPTDAHSGLNCMLKDCDVFKAGICLAQVADPLYIELTDTREDYYRKRIRRDSAVNLLKTEINKYRRSVDSISKIIKKESHVYKLQITKETKNKIRFNLKCDAKNNNEINAFENTEWKYFDNGGGPLNALAFKKTWTSCELTKNGDQFTMTLKDLKDEISLQQLQIRFNAKVKKKHRAQRIQEINEAYKIISNKYKSELDDLEQAKLPFQERMTPPGISIDSISSVQNSHNWIFRILKEKNIPVTCFWSESKPYMTEAESKLDFIDWCQYFDANKKLMFERYTSLSKTRFDCSAGGGSKIVCIIPMQPFVGGGLSKIDSIAKFIGEQVNISSMGIFNFDVLEKMENTIEILASYRNNAGDVIKPTSIYVLDKSVNGLVKYDQYGTYTPKRFIFSRNAVITVIAITDVDGEITAYVCNSKKLNSRDVKEKQISKTIVLEKIEKVKNKNELRRMF